MKPSAKLIIVISFNLVVYDTLFIQVFIDFTPVNLRLIATARMSPALT